VRVVSSNLNRPSLLSTTIIDFLAKRATLFRDELDEALARPRYGQVPENARQ
jgi:hypothetical protein